MRNLCGIVAAILKMATGRNLSMSGINSGHHKKMGGKNSTLSDIINFLYMDRYNVMKSRIDSQH
jgi:hypothetical protein